MGKYVPPLTVASLAMIRHSRPWIRPTPVIIPAAGAPSSYIPFAARGESSRKGVSGSSSALIRSRGGTFPCSRCRARYFGPPPSRAAASRSFNSSTSPCSRCAFCLKSSEAVSRCVCSGSMPGGREYQSASDRGSTREPGVMGQFQRKTVTGQNDGSYFAHR